MDNRVENFIKHYASQYYDPAKAHAYYLETRQLKGRTTNGMSDAQKEAWGYTKQTITKERDAKIEELRQKAQDTRNQIYAKLSAFANKPELKRQEASAERERIAKELKAAIESVRSEYEAIFNKEYDTIKSTIQGKPPKQPKPKKGKQPKEGQVDWETFDKT